MHSEAPPLFWAPLPGRAWYQPVRQQPLRGNPGSAISSLGRNNTDSTANERGTEKERTGNLEKVGFLKNKKKQPGLECGDMSAHNPSDCLHTDETCDTVYLVKIFGPFGVEVTVRFLWLWFENTNDFLQKEKRMIKSVISKMHFDTHLAHGRQWENTAHT